MGQQFTYEEKRQIWEREDGICQECHLPIGLLGSKEFHHIIPCALGGDQHDIANGALLHTVCHSRNYEKLHGTRLTAQRASQSKKALKYWIYKRGKK